MESGPGDERDDAAESVGTPGAGETLPEIALDSEDASEPQSESETEGSSGAEQQSLVHPRDDQDVEPTAVPATSPFGITVPVPIVSDRELGIGRLGAHAAGAPPRAGAIVGGAVILEEPPPPTYPPSPVTTPLRAALLWAGIGVLLIAALLSTIAALNNDIYSAPGFVRQYLAAVETGNADVALAFSGVDIANGGVAASGIPEDAARTLLRGSVMRGPEEYRLVSDTETKPGMHTVVYSVVLDGESHEASFDVVRDGSWAGVFHSWRFATSPLAAVTVTVLHDASFTVNGLTLDTRVHAAEDAEPTFNNSASYLVFSPGVYEFSRDSKLLKAAPSIASVVEPGATAVTVDVQASPTFVSEVQTELNGFLDQCAEQEVLQPTDCPFGTVIDDRVIGAPAWTIVAYPEVTLVADDTAFQMPATTGTAHIVVQVQSLFDGEETTVDRDEPYTMSASVTIAPDGTLNIQLH